MVTRTTDIDHPDRNCVSRVCDRCETVIACFHHERESALDLHEEAWRESCERLKASCLEDLCRRCQGKDHANDQKA